MTLSFTARAQVPPIAGLSGPSKARKTTITARVGDAPGVTSQTVVVGAAASTPATYADLGPHKAAFNFADGDMDAVTINSASFAPIALSGTFAFNFAAFTAGDHIWAALVDSSAPADDTPLSAVVDLGILGA